MNEDLENMESINLKKKENSGVEDGIKKCPKCGNIVEAVFCIECGANYKDSIDRNRNYLGHIEKMTEFYKKNHPDAFNQIEEIAISNGFKKLLIDTKSDKVNVKPEITEEAVFYSPEHLNLHEKLMMEYDENIAKDGADCVIKHEISHFEQPSEKFIKNQEIFISFLKSKEGKELLEEMAKQKHVSSIEVARRLLSRNKINNEMQTDIIATTRNFENEDQFVNNCAIQGIYSSFLYDGEDSLNKNYIFGREGNFIKSTVKDKIYKREEEIKDYLLKKHNEYLEKIQKK